MEHVTQGKHCIVDAWDCSAEVLQQHQRLQKEMVNAAEASGATVLSVQKKPFAPHNGITILVMLAESHFSLHTYPERHFAALDCYTCGENVNPEKAVQHLLDILNPKTIHVKTLLRGSGEIREMRGGAEVFRR